MRRHQPGRVRSLFGEEEDALDELDGEWMDEALTPEQELWEAVLRTLELSMTRTRATFDQCLRHTHLVACEEAYCTVLARPQAIEWLGGRLHGQIQAAIEQQLGRPIEVYFVSNEDEF